MMIGHPLDIVFNNGKDTTGCQQRRAGTSAPSTGKKLIQTSFNYGSQTPEHATRCPANLPNQPAVGLANLVAGGGNPVSFSPSPEPARR